MRLLMIAPAFLPAYAHGGVPRSSFGLAKGLAEMRHEVQVVASNRNGSEQLEVQADRFGDYKGLAVCYCSARAGSYLYSGSAKKILTEELEKADCVLHQGTTWTHFGLIAAQSSRRRPRKPYIIWPRGVLAGQALAISPVKKSIYWRLCMQNWYKRARAIVATGESEVEQITDMVGHKRIEVIPNGIELEPLEVGAGKEELQQEFGQQLNGRIILALGRLCPIKGLTHLIEAFGVVQESFPESVLVIAGPDENGYKNKLLARAQSLQLNGRVVFTGKVEGRLKVGLLRSAEVLAMPSDSESFGISAAEAAACGVPVVLTKRCGIAKDIAEARAGIIVQQRAPDIAEAIKTLLSNQATQNQMGDSGKRLVRDKYSWHRIAEQTDNLIRELI